ncbi:MAG: phosphate ABC transporter permease subunit PstC [Bacteroidota bacterium]|nr:phosphate ABC transporter permease subunit PstC [Bacteroidota bacterium]
MNIQFIKEKGIEWLLAACAGISILTTVGIIYVLFIEAFHFFQEVSIIDFFTDSQWTPLFADKHFGIWALLSGTLLTSFIALLVGVPSGLVIAIYLSEYASAPVRKWTKPILEILAGIPTIVYGYFALFTLTPLLQNFFPQLSGFNALSPGIVMGFMILPLVSSLSEDALFAVPKSLREAGYAVGANKVEVSLGIVFPSALSGIVASVILALSRAIGETMIVAIAAGQFPNITFNPMDAISTMTAYIVQVSQGDTPAGTLEYRTIFAVAACLFVFTLFLNMMSFRIRKKYFKLAS